MRSNPGSDGEPEQQRPDSAQHLPGIWIQGVPGSMVYQVVDRRPLLELTFQS